MENARGSRRFGSVDKRGPSYRARYKGPDLRYHVRTFDTKKLADRWLANEGELLDLNKITPGSWTPPSTRRDKVTKSKEAAVTTVAGFLQSVINKGVGPKGPWSINTRQTHQRALDNQIKPYLGDVALADLTPALVHEWRWTRLDQTHGTSNGRAYDFLRQAMGFAVDQGLMKTNPCQEKVIGGVRPGKPTLKLDIEVMTDDETVSFLAATPSMYRLALSVLVYCGLRPTELLALHVSDMDMRQKRIHIGRDLVYDEKARAWVEDDTKTPGSKDWVTIPQPLVEPLEAHLKGLKDHRPKSYVFVRSDGHRPMSYDTLNKVCERVSQASLGRQLSLYDLRHTAATNTLLQGGSIIAVQRLLRQSSITMTQRYVHATDRQEAARADRQARVMMRAAKRAGVELFSSSVE